MNTHIHTPPYVFLTLKVMTLYSTIKYVCAHHYHGHLNQFTFEYMAVSVSLGC